MYNGLAGAYLGLGIDEFGNFLNGTTNTLNSGATVTGDNTADGAGQYANRIGLRGAGNITWAALNNAYGATQLASAAKPYYPTSLTNCPSGSNFDSNANICESCPTGSTYTTGAAGQIGLCSVLPIPGSCPAGSSVTADYNGNSFCLNTTKCSGTDIAIRRRRRAIPRATV